MTDRENFEAWVRDTKGESFLQHAESPALWRGDTTQHDANPYEHPWTRGAWEGYQAALASQQPADDGWIDWAGSYEHEPVAEHTPVNVKYRDGSVSAGFSTSLMWGHRPNKPSWDIIAYRVVKP